jgi:hypothetical protein
MDIPSYLIFHYFQNNIASIVVDAAPRQNCLTSAFPCVECVLCVAQIATQTERSGATGEP